MGRLDAKVVPELLIYERTFGKLRMLRPVLLHHQSLLASRNLADGPWRLELWHLYGLRRLLREFLRVALDLQPCSCSEGAGQRRMSCTNRCQLSSMPWLFVVFWYVLRHYRARNNDEGTPLLVRDSLHPLSD
jgi:hypothetical protein